MILTIDMKKILVQVFDFFSSIKLAVILILSLAIIFATGTFYEAAHGTDNAQRVIYKSWYVSVEMFLLIVNLACAAIDRLPWKKITSDLSSLTQASSL